jgi:hypothetical protein
MWKEVQLPMTDDEEREYPAGAHARDSDATQLRAYLTMAQAAALLGVHPATLSQQALAGKLQTARLGRMYVTTRGWLDAYRARHAGQPGRSPEVTAQDRYNRRFTTVLALDRRRTPEALRRASVDAGVDTMWEYPDTTPAQLREIVAAHRRTVLPREAEADRAEAAAAIAGAVFASPGIDAEHYAAQREAARESPSALGRRWRELFYTLIASADEEVTPQNLGVIARLDQKVVQALAEELLHGASPLPVHECRAHLIQAMLEGSLNLPEDSGACREMIENTVERGMRAAIRALRQHRAAAGHGATESA